MKKGTKTMPQSRVSQDGTHSDNEDHGENGLIDGNHFEEININEEIDLEARNNS
jgi:hypothetical protein